MTNYHYLKKKRQHVDLKALTVSGGSHVEL